MDIIDIDILEDGTISVKTSDIAEANHVSADQLLADIANMAGGERSTRKREHPFWKNRRVLRGGRIVRTRS